MALATALLLCSALCVAHVLAVSPEQIRIAIGADETQMTVVFATSNLTEPGYIPVRRPRGILPCTVPHPHHRSPSGAMRARRCSTRRPVSRTTTRTSRRGS